MNAPISPRTRLPGVMLTAVLQAGIGRKHSVDRSDITRNEGAGLTGATHLLEHLMFKGSERFNRDLGTSVFQVLQSVGGSINATTWYDRTNYFAVLPEDQLHLAVEVEADRMRGARVRDEDLPLRFGSHL